MIEPLEFKERLKKNGFVIASLLHLYSLQTGDEKLTSGTIHQNEMGFNAPDSPILSSISEYYLKKRRVTPKQLDFVRRTLIKYHGQIPEDLLPLEISPYKEPPKLPSIKTAELRKDNYLEIKFSFSKGDPEFRETLSKVKSLNGRTWKSEGLFWKAYPYPETIENLQKWGFSFGPNLQQHIKKINEPVKELDMSQLNLPIDLYPFQKEGVKFIHQKKGRALIADEMGLGKTIQAVAWLAANPEVRPTLVICPASLKLNWKREIQRLLPNKNIQIISGTTPSTLSNDINIINYDILKSHLDSIQELSPKVLIVDEAHHCKNPQTIRTHIVKKLSKAEHFIALTGTPIENRPKELFPIIQMIKNDLFPSFWRYAQRYCNPKHNGFGWDFNGSSNTKELHEKLTSTIMIRRKKEDVLQDLPEKTRTIIPLEIDNRSEYIRAQEDIIQWIKNNEGREEAQRAFKAEALVRMEKLKQISVKGKWSLTLCWIKDFLETESKLVLFCTHKSTIDSLMEFSENNNIKAVKLDGRSSAEERQKAVNDFQDDPSVQLFIGNIKAAGVGITLTAASSACFLELPWTPGALSQAEDRIHRIGQKDSAKIYYLVANNTIEDTMLSLIDQKRMVIDMVMDGKETSENETLMSLLLKELNNN